MRAISSLLLLSTAPLAVSAADAPRPRGVAPDCALLLSPPYSPLTANSRPTVAKFYKDTSSFTCIFNPSIKLSLSQVNDDYCDCPDGSDEPGTAACSHISPHSPRLASDSSIANANNTAALPGFYCKNKGHQPSYVPFTNVNDGVCDYTACCDGSDEWAQVGGVSCPDKCKEIGAEWRKLDETRQKSMTAALKKKTELVAEATRLRKTVEEKVADLTQKIAGQAVKVKDLEQKLQEAEIKAKGKVVKGDGTGGKIGVFAGLAKDRVDELRRSLVSVRKSRDAAKERLEELEKILTTFKEEYNPNFNDEGVKRAVRAWDDYSAKEKPAYEDQSVDHDLDEVTKEDTDTEGLKWADWTAEDKSDTDLLYDFEAYLPASLRSWVDTRLRELRLLLIENGIIAGTDISGDKIDPEVSSARSQHKAAEKDLEDFNRDLKRETEDLAKDYGPQSIFRALKGKCVSRDSGEYTYELCWFEKTKQKSKKGGGETNMGNYVSYEMILVDDELPPDGKGLGSGTRIALKHENGQHCWNGPNRSTMVILGCAETDEIWKVSEEEKCVYRMEVGTPAVCEGREKKKEQNVKDEL